MIINGIILSILNALLIGITVYNYWDKNEDTIIRVCNGMYLGLVITSILFWLYTVICNGQNGLYPAFELLLGMIIWCISCRHARKGKKDVCKENNKNSLIDDYIAVVIIILIAVLVLGRLKLYPWGNWDAVAMWNIKASFLANGNEGMWLRMFDNVFDSAHRDYPLALSCIVARGFVFSNSGFWLIPGVYSLFFTISCFILLYIYLKKAINSFYGLCGIALMSLTGNLALQGSKESADILLVIFALIAFYQLLKWGKRDGKDAPVLALIYLSSCLWIKNEGIPFFICGIVFILLNIQRITYKNIWGLVLPIIPALLASFSVKYISFASNDLMKSALTNIDNFLDIELYINILGYCFHNILPIAFWLIICPIVVYVVGRRKTPRIVLQLFGIPMFCYLIYGSAYIISPYDVLWHLEMSLPRVIIHYMPTLFFLTGIVIGYINDKQPLKQI